MERLDLFPTPIFVFHLEALPDVQQLDPEVKERLILESETTPGLSHSNAGGWHSIPDLAQRTEPCFRTLAARTVHHVHNAILEICREAGATTEPRFGLSAHGWAMVMRDGHYSVLHDHAEAHWSCAYYVDAGDADLARWPQSGMLALVDPRRGAVKTPLGEAGVTFALQPTSGMLVVFPGSVQHYVHPYRGTRPRVSVSFNLMIRPER